MLRVVQRLDDGECIVVQLPAVRTHDRLDPDVTGDVVVNADVGPGGPHDENDAVWDGSTLCSKPRRRSVRREP